jgi:hypothetical protein
MAEPRVTNQDLLLQIVRDIEVLKQNSIQILQASQDHETRIRELEKDKHSNAWIFSTISSLIAAGTTVAIMKMMGY